MASQRLKIMVSSSVYGFEDQLTQIGALLQGRGYGYEVINSFLGTVTVAPGQHNFEACIQAVERCDLFLGIIRGRYGSGVEARAGLSDGQISVTHQEIRRAIQADKPRWFLVDAGVDTARKLLRPLRPHLDGELFDAQQKAIWKPTENPMRGNPILDDLRVLAMYEEALLPQTPLPLRRNWWCQPYRDITDILRFLRAQFGDQERLRAMLNPAPSP